MIRASKPIMTEKSLISLICLIKFEAKDIMVSIGSIEPSFTELLKEDLGFYLSQNPVDLSL